MAAVMALVFLFVFASVALMVKISIGSLGLATGLAMGIFVLLAGGVFIGAMLQAKHWDEDGEKHT